MDPLCSKDRCGKKVRRVGHPGANRLERRAGARKSNERRSAAQAAVGRGLLTGGVKLPLALAELGLIDEYEFLAHPRLADEPNGSNRAASKQYKRDSWRRFTTKLGAPIPAVEKPIHASPGPLRSLWTAAPRSSMWARAAAHMNLPPNR